jgi:hypothetical protein
MAASFPSGIKNFSVVVNGVTKLVAALFNSPYDEITAIETQLLGSLMGTDGAIKIASVNTTALKTATGEVSGVTGLYTLPGGEYGFFPQIKANTAHSITVMICQDAAVTTSYVTSLHLNDGYGTPYAQQRYVTASGEDLWIFLLLNKITKEIIAAYQAPDHPAYGNGGDFDKMPHPFGSYDEAKHEIVLVDKDTCLAIKAESKQTGKSILTLVNEIYKVDMDKELKYEPLHSGRFIEKTPELLLKIPNYIKVRKLKKGG